MKRGPSVVSMTTKAMILSIVAAVALVGSVAAAGLGCPMMRSPATLPAVPGTPPAAAHDVGSSPESPRQAQALSGSAERGQQVYLARCTACHSTDPGRNGPVGPAVRGAAIDLVRARVLRAAYPPGHVPKRPTRIMPAQPDLAPWIVDLAAFLSTP